MDLFQFYSKIFIESTHLYMYYEVGLNLPIFKILGHAHIFNLYLNLNLNT